MSNDMMSQEEIERMLAGGSDGGTPDPAPAAASSSETMSPEEIEALMGGGASPAPADAGGDVEDLRAEDYLSRDEMDVLGEVANICMGTSATTMSTLLSMKVMITTPTVMVENAKTMGRKYEAPLVVAEVKYIEGLKGDNLLLLKEYDVALITNVLLGEDTNIDPNNIDLNDIHMSAMNEVMNQMVGSSATSLADVLHKKIDISTPTTKRLTLKENGFDNIFAEHEPVVKISFKMEIEGLLTSEIMQIIPIELAKSMASDIMVELYGGMEEAAPAPRNGKDRFRRG